MNSQIPFSKGGAKAPPDSLSVLSKLNSFDDATEKSLGDKGETFVDELMDRHQILVENSQSKTPTKKLSALSKFKKIKDEEKSLNSNGSEPAENQGKDYLLFTKMLLNK